MIVEQLDEPLANGTGGAEDTDSYRHCAWVRHRDVSAFGYAPVSQATADAARSGAPRVGIFRTVLLNRSDGYARTRALSPRPSTPRWER